MENKHLELRLTGSGGQGLILAGVILAEAALLEGMNAIQTQSYGPEARGGSSKAEVIISNKEIDFPKVTEPNIILSLTQDSADMYTTTIGKTGIVVVDSSIEVTSSLKNRTIKVPIIETAKTVLGKEIVANIIALGFLVEYTNIISKESLEKAVLARVPRGTEELNKKALTTGYELAIKIK
jgi:2-oxoglutarate ferredoxin oxidoreductase subunit gamma